MRSAEPERLMRERKQVWWTSAIAGPVDQAYPVAGVHLKVHLDGDTLIIGGTVGSEQDRQEIQDDARRLIGKGISAIQFDVTVESESGEEDGLLAQTIVSIFATESQARFAESTIVGQGHFRPVVLRVITPDTPQPSAKPLRDLLGEPAWEDVRAALAESHSVLILALDETVAFAAREMLDEETRSLRTTVLPPVPAATARRCQSELKKRGLSNQRTTVSSSPARKGAD